MGQSTPERPVMRGKAAPALLDASPRSELKKLKIGQPY
jgi:hypothetical protein